MPPPSEPTRAHLTHSLIHLVNAAQRSACRSQLVWSRCHHRIDGPLKAFAGGSQLGAIGGEVHCIAPPASGNDRRDERLYLVRPISQPMNTLTPCCCLLSPPPSPPSSPHYPSFWAVDVWYRNDMPRQMPITNTNNRSTRHWNLPKFH